MSRNRAKSSHIGLVETINRPKKRDDIKPITENQRIYWNYLFDQKHDIVIGTGPAGVGKTILPTTAGLSLFTDGEYNKIVITRPAVPTSEEEHGFLPGTLQEKMYPWVRPIYDIMLDHYAKSDLDWKLNEEEIEIAPLAYMRGRSLNRCFIIADEMQNSTPEQMKMLLTRIGKNSKLVVTGDLKQSDRDPEKNGLHDLMMRLERRKLDRIAVVSFGPQDIQRSEVLKEVLEIYGDL